MSRVTAMKWREIVRFEVVYQLRRWSTWIFFGVYLLLLFGQTNGQLIEAHARGIPFHAPLFIAQSSVFMTMLALLVMAAVAGDAATRDIETGVEPLMHAAPIGRAAYVGGRFLGAFLVCALVLLAVPLALILGPIVGGLGPDLVGPFRPAAFLQDWFLIILPNAFVAVAVLFALAILVRHALGSYFAAAMLFLWAVLASQVVGQALGRWDLAKLLDPVGRSALELMARTWSPGDRNGRLVGVDGGLLWNRLLWITVGIAALGFAYVRFRYGANARTVRWWQRRRTPVAPPEHEGAPVAVPRAPRHFGPAARVRQTLAVARDSLREITTRWTWLVVPFLALQGIVTLGEMQVKGTPTVPTTARVLDTFGDLPPPLAISIFLLALLLAGELVWRERDANLGALSDAAPVPDGVRFVGKLLGLWLVIVVLRALQMLTGIIIQVRLGWLDIDFGLYLQTLLGLALVPPLVFALVSLSVHVLVNQKQLGHLAVLAIMIGGSALAETVGIEHPLLFPFAMPGWRYSAISGFGSSAGPFLWFMLYWAGWTLVLALVAGLFWVNGVALGVGERLRVARQRLRTRPAGVVMAAPGLVLLVGGFIFYNTNILNDYHSSAEGSDRRAEYERRYARYADAPEPELRGAKLAVELYPDRRAADIRGTYRLVNRTGRPIDTLHVAVSLEARTSGLDFGRPARAALLDDTLGHRIYVLEAPLQPGDSLQMRWQVRYHPRGFPARDMGTAVLGNGSFIEMHDWVPQFGYQSDRELTDSDRERHGLPAHADVHSLDNLAARSDRTGQERFDLDVTVGTAANQTAVAPGALLGRWMRDGRRYFHYASPAIGPGYAIFSARYAVQRARAGAVAIEVVYDPAHGANVDRMLRSMQVSLGQYTRRFGPYPYPVLRMVEDNHQDGGAHAASSTIWYTELFALFDPAHDERRIDLPFAVTAHETAHQFQAAPARVEGRALLSESFAWYAALGVIEQQYGAAHLQRFLDFMRRDYLSPRSRADVPLLRSSNWFQAYRKGPFAMYALREYVGQDRVDLAWRRLIAEHASGQPPFATSLDLYRELRAVTPDSLQYLLHDLIEANTFWELETERATARQAPTGAWQVTLDLKARKVAVDAEGAETPVPMNDWVELGVFEPAGPGEQPGRLLYRQMHRVRTGTQAITITVPRRPGRAGIDPRRLLMDVEPGDNDKPVQIAPGDGS